MVLRLGKGSSALSSAGTSAFVERRKYDGTLSKLITIEDTVAASAFTLNGTATTEGGLSLSEDGHYVTFGGYAAVAGTTGPSAGSAISTSPTTGTGAVLRAIGRVNASDGFDFWALPSDAFSGSNIRGATSTDGSAIWASGSASGTGTGARYWVYAAGTDTALTSSTLRAVNVFADQVFASTSTTVSTLGAGLPTAAATLTALPGFTSGSPNSFVFLDMNSNGFGTTGLDTLYVADDRGTASGGGLQKWTYSDASSTWTLASTWTATTAVRGLAGIKVGSTVYLVASTTETSANRLVTWVDTGSGTPSATLISTAGANTIYRGLAFKPH
jgi:hypothetical protein